MKCPVAGHGRTPAFEALSTPVTSTASSGPEPSRHKRLAA